MSATTIDSVVGRRIWDSRGRPTVEAEVRLRGGATGRAIAPAGASTGLGEAVERRDGGAALGGYDVAVAVGAIGREISGALAGLDALEQGTVDRCLIALDGTPDKSRLGANAIVAVSMANAHAAAAATGIPLWRYLLVDQKPRLPLPQIQIFGGGAHAGGRVDIQDFMVAAVGAEDFVQALDWTAEVYLAAGAIMSDRGLLRGVADEGGYWPAFESNEEGLQLLVAAIERAGLIPGEEMAISLDIAASQLGAGGRYRLGLDRRELDSDELIAMLLDWIARYPIVAVEDPVAEGDARGFRRLVEAVGDRIAVVGDDLLVTSADRVREAAAAKQCNALLMKPNQAGTLSEAKEALEVARNAGWATIASARSGESEDVTIVHIAVGWRAEMLKVGSFARSERLAKWNEGIRIAEALGGRGELPARRDFPWGR
ncbi:MAG: phosphopyruvate hydratase [Rhodospirillales bacterium]|nr:MAG: phosphopyruvate hydratase [Rhodospirillales bacterium]